MATTVNVTIAIGGVDNDREHSNDRALHYLGRMTEALFETQMRRAALRIGTQQSLFPH